MASGGPRSKYSLIQRLGTPLPRLNQAASASFHSANFDSAAVPRSRRSRQSTRLGSTTSSPPRSAARPHFGPTDKVDVDGAPAKYPNKATQADNVRKRVITRFGVGGSFSKVLGVPFLPLRTARSR